jgi:hypothetical protein
MVLRLTGWLNCLEFRLGEEQNRGSQMHGSAPRCLVLRRWLGLGQNLYALILAKLSTATGWACYDGGETLHPAVYSTTH